MNLLKKSILFCLLIAATVFSIKDNLNTLFSDPFSNLKQFSKYILSDDKSFLEKQDFHFNQLVCNIRKNNKTFYIHPYDSFLEQIATEHALPVLPTLSKNPHSNEIVQLFGPNPHCILEESTTPVWKRWVRILFTLVCWIGITFFIKNISFIFRMLTGICLFGWGAWALSWLSHLSLEAIYSVVVPISLLGFFTLILKKRLHSKINIKNLFVFVFVFILFSEIWFPFLTADVSGSDSRIMWLYRFKFMYLFGFNPELIVNSMLPGAQRDYPWFLSGALSIASFGDRSHFAGWNENAVYGSMFVILLCGMGLWLRFLNHRPTIIKICMFLTTFVSFHYYITNGYLDIYWMMFFSLFLFGYYERELQKDKCSFNEFELFILLMLSVSTKNEGLASFILFALFEVFRSFKRQTLSRFLFGKLSFYSLACFPVFLQNRVLSFHGIVDQYRLGSRFFEINLYEAIKLFEAATRYIFKHVFIMRPKYWIPIALILIYGILIKHKTLGVRLFGLILYYSIPAMVIYTYTRADQYWQIETSVYRVFMFWIFFVFGFFQIHCPKEKSFS